MQRKSVLKSQYAAAGARTVDLPPAGCGDTGTGAGAGLYNFVIKVHQYTIYAIFGKASKRYLSMKFCWVTSQFLVKKPCFDVNRSQIWRTLVRCR